MAARACLLFLVLSPVLAFALYLRRLKRNMRLALGTLALGAILFVPAELFERWVETWTGLDEHAGGHVDLAALLYAFFVASPLEQGMKFAAVVPLFRSRRIDSPIDRVVYAASAALGFITLDNAGYLWDQPLTVLAVSRCMLAIPAHVFCAAIWGYTLGRDPKRRFGGRAFNATWLVATFFNGVYDHIVFGRTGVALLATVPILLGMGAVAYVTARDIRRRSEIGSSVRTAPRRFSLAPPSIGAVRAALRRTERPLRISWIGFGALVTTGVLSASLGGAVALGHRVGVDFAAVDRGDASAASAAPLVLLAVAALASFPIAGFLIARASSARSVLEPAIAAALAIAGCLVLLGLAAPVAVVFAIAFAPIAFGLGCAGAWLGMGSG